VTYFTAKTTSFRVIHKVDISGCCEIQIMNSSIQYQTCNYSYHS